MNKFFQFLFGLVFSLNCFGQSEIKIRITYDKISSNVELLTLNSNGSYSYEKYNYFKYKYFKSFNDSLFQVSDSIYKGNKVNVNIKEFTSKAPCDSLINIIKNSTLSAESWSMVTDTAKLHIGYGNSEFTQKSRESAPTNKDEYLNCHAYFKVLNTLWFEQQIALIQTIKEKKIERYEWITQTDSINNDFIHAFLNDFGNCETDFKALIVLIQKNTNSFLTICKYMDDLKFHSLKFKLEDFPESINSELAILSLKNSKIRTVRKRKIIKNLTND